MAVSRTNLSPSRPWRSIWTAWGRTRCTARSRHRSASASAPERCPPASRCPPPARSAANLGVSRGVVVEAYAQLVAEGYLTSRSGGYTQVAPALARPARSRLAAIEPPRDGSGSPVANPSGAPWSGPARPAVDFGYGRGNLSAFPRGAWLRSVRRVLTQTPDDRLGYIDGRGAPELRSALADYLNRVRGTHAEASRRSSSPTATPRRCPCSWRVLAARGATALAVEDPSASDDARPSAQALGMQVVGVPVGDDGVQVEALSELRADALILTPSHQWPTGGVLSPATRAAVLAWAQRTGALVIEDDYDAEYRYDRPPVGAIQGLDPDRVVYAGTASKTLAPGFRLGWLVLPPDLVEPCRHGQAARRPRLAHPGPAHLRRLPLPRRVRSPPAAHAAPVPLAPRCSPGRTRRARPRSRARRDRRRPAPGGLAARSSAEARRHRGRRQ